MQLTTALLLLASATSTLAGPANVQYRTFESKAAPRGWRQVRKANPSYPLNLKIHLSQQNVAEFEQLVYDISTPGHAMYGKHLTREQTKKMLAPSDKTVSAVTDWIKSLGLGDKMRVEDDWIFVDADVESAEHLLKAKYHNYGHDEHDGVVRTEAYSIPAHLHEHINMIHPTTSWFGASGGRRGVMKTQVRPAPKNRRRQDATADCNRSITPECLRKLYNVGNFTLQSAEKAGVLGVAGYLEQYAQQSDLEAFSKKFMGGAKVSFKCSEIHGGKCTDDPEPSLDFTEANLDIQYTVALSYPLANAYYSTGGRPPINNGTGGGENTNEPYFDFLDWLQKQKDLPHTLTTSYGEEEESVPLSYMNTVCNMFAQLGAQGVSIMFSSGDSGPGDQCKDKDGKPAFDPTFPAGCPFVTAVGGTTGFDKERAVGLSSGGFSNTWAQPAYQKELVGKWLSSGGDAEKYAKYYNKTGRGIPDVAAQGANYHVFVDGYDQLVSGTSASSPAFAGLIGLINGDRVAKGKPPMGFLNPWIYGAGKEGFNDITSGNSEGCSGTIEGGATFNGVEGWDPVTGVGSPNFQKMLELARKYTPGNGKGY